MASYRGHLMLSAPLGAAYGAAWMVRPEADWGPALLGAGLTAIGGLLPDLDSDSGVPVRELFGILAAGVAVVMLHPLKNHGMPLEQSLVILGGVYFLIRYLLADVFRRLTVHRGMYHSIPAMLISGLVVFHLYPVPDLILRLYLGGGVMVGFLSHLVLDEIYSVDFLGFRVKLNKYAGSAVKFTSSSAGATLTAYTILFVLGYLVFQPVPDWMRLPEEWQRPGWMDVVRRTAGVR